MCSVFSIKMFDRRFPIKLYLSLLKLRGMCLCVWEESDSSSHLSFRPLLLFHLVTDAPGEWLRFWYLLVCMCVWCALPPRHKLTTFYRCVRIRRPVPLYIIGMVGRRRTIWAKISTPFTANSHTLILLAVWGNTSFSRPFHIDYRQGIVRPINRVQPESLSREDERSRLF